LDNATGRGASTAPSIPETEVVTVGGPVDGVENDVEESQPSGDEFSDVEEEISTEQRADQMITWQEELDDSISNQPTEIKDWAILHAQIKADLKRKHKSYSLAEMNKLFILCNFATLHLKGWTCMEASLEISEQWHEQGEFWFAQKVWALAQHYQTFEQLPVEHCGGYINAEFTKRWACQNVNPWLS
jgi:hypothetical protein